MTRPPGQRASFRPERFVRPGHVTLRQMPRQVDAAVRVTG